MASNRYARGLAPRPDIQPPRRTYRPPRYSPTPVRPPLPANDNSLPASRIPPGLPKSARWALARRIGLRAVPILGWALTAYEVGRYLRGLYDIAAVGHAYRFSPAGYTLVNDCADISGQKLVYSRFSRACGSRTGIVNTPSQDPWGPYPSMHLWRLTAPGDFGYQPSGRVGVTERWDRNPVGPYIAPGYVPIPEPWVQPDIPTRPFDPTPEPRPPRVRPRRRPDPNPETPPVGRPAEEPLPRVNPRPSRPPRGTRERKVATDRRTRRLLGWLLSGYSEVSDLIDALYDALHEDYQDPRDVTPYDKFQTLWEHIDKVNMSEAMTNIVRDQIEDPKMAEAFERAQELFESYGIELPDLRGIGGTSGPWNGSF